MNSRHVPRSDQTVPFFVRDIQCVIRGRWRDHGSFLAFFFRNGTGISVVPDGVLALGDGLPSLLDFVGVFRILRVELEENPFLPGRILARAGMEFDFLQRIAPHLSIERLGGGSR